MYYYDIKVMPSRFATQRGLCAKYPDSFIEIFKMSVPSTDDEPHIMLTESQLGHINDTVAYVPADTLPEMATQEDDLMPEVVVKTAKKKCGKKPKQAEAQAVETKGLNKLDQIEIAVIGIKEKFVAAGSTVGDDHISMVRSKLLEYVLRGGKMELQVIVAGKKTMKPLKSLESAISHFKNVALEMHQAMAGFHLRVEECEEDKKPADEDDNDDNGLLVAFTLSLPKKMIDDVESQKVKWIIRPKVGTNMTKKVKIGAGIELRNNTVRFLYNVVDVISAEANGLYTILSGIERSGSSMGEAGIENSTTVEDARVLKYN